MLTLTENAATIVKQMTDTPDAILRSPEGGPDATSGGTLCYGFPALVRVAELADALA